MVEGGWCHDRSNSQWFRVCVCAHANIAAGTHGSGFRIFEVAALQDYCNVTTPQSNLTASIPWGRPVASGAQPAGAPPGAVGADVMGMSAMCYFFGVEIATGNHAIHCLPSPRSCATYHAREPEVAHTFSSMQHILIFRSE